MKTSFCVALLWCTAAFGADILTEKLQRGLFEEEANHNLDAAIKEYQSVVSQADEQRKVIATALFRLGECYRKLGRTNEAATFYRRITRDFSEQEQLARLAHDLLKSETGTASAASAVAPSWRTVSDPEQVRLLQEEIKLAEQQVAAVEKNHAVGVAPLAAVLNAKRDVLAVRRLLPENSSLMRQRALLDEQVKIVEQLLKETEQRVKVGVVPTTEAIPLRRELLTLQRETAGLTESSGTSAATASQSTLTQAEAEALARAKTLARNSPDLLQSPTRDGLGELQLGARDGYYSVVEFILGQGVSANGPERGTPPIVLAAGRGHLRIVQLLLDKGADVNAMGGGNTALMSACDNGYRAVVELLLQRGADVNRLGDGSALHKVAAKGYAGLAELLLQHGATTDVVRGSAKDTPLHYAMGYPNVAEALLKAGASATVTNSAGVTPLHLAASRGDTNIAARLLDKGANPNAEDAEGRTPLYNATLDQARSAAIVRLLLTRGADVNRRYIIKRQGYATMNVGLLHSAIADGRQDIVDTILDAKPDLQLVNQGLTPLMVAINAGRVDMVERLLRAGADPNFSLPEFDPPLFRAVNGTLPIIAALLKNGANPNFVNSRGFTPLFGVSNPEILQLFLDHKADPNKGTNPLTELLGRRVNRPPGPAGSDRPDIYPAIELLLKGGANPNATFTDGTRLLTYAVSTRDAKLVDSLLKYNAEVNYVANNETPLSLAQRNARNPQFASSNPQIISEWEQIEKALRDHGANEYLQRLSTISYARPAWTSGDGKTVFSRGTNDYNRHTLFEMIAAVFTGNDQPAFPDLSRVTIERLEGANPKRKELALNIDELLRAGDCSKDTWVEWGDRFSFPETDHPLNEGWAGLPQETFDLLTKCLTRRISIIVKQETNAVKLVPNWGGPLGVATFGTSSAPPNYPAVPSQPLRSIPIRAARQPVGEAPAPAQEKPEKVLHTFRLKEVVYAANVLRASSDPTRVRVTRREDDRTKDWVFDLTKVATSSEWNSPGPVMFGGAPVARRLSPSEDLWLREGDMIEIPEKQ